MKKNKLVIFDWGGVIESHSKGTYNDEIVIRKILTKMGLKNIPTDFLLKWKECAEIGSSKNMFCCNKEEDIKLFSKKVLESFNLNSNNKEIRKFIEVYKEEFSKNYYFKEISEFASNLNQICYNAILSNLYILDKERISKQLNFSKFDFVWLSCDLEMMKPDENIYKKVLEDSKFKPRDILFIDDNIENLKKAHSLGFRTYLATSEDFENIKSYIDYFLYR